jgi:hypothetical protein
MIWLLVDGANPSAGPHGRAVMFNLVVSHRLGLFYDVVPVVIALVRTFGQAGGRRVVGAAPSHAIDITSVDLPMGQGVGIRRQ